jgi:hypothetical protein
VADAKYLQLFYPLPTISSLSPSKVLFVSEDKASKSKRRQGDKPMLKQIQANAQDRSEGRQMYTLRGYIGKKLAATE